jgi:hypothetical protein
MSDLANQFREMSVIRLKHFYLKRTEDETGVSGEGIVGVGAVFPSGICIVEWLTFTSSLNHYRSLDHVKEVHGHGGKTEVVMGDPPVGATVTKVS